MKEPELIVLVSTSYTVVNFLCLGYLVIPLFWAPCAFSGILDFIYRGPYVPYIVCIQ